MSTPPPPAPNTINESCSICFEGINSVTIYELLCTHYFHKDCILQWINWCNNNNDNNNTCPLCRYQLDPDLMRPVGVPFEWDWLTELASYRAGTLGVDVLQNDLRRIRSFCAAQGGRRVAQASVDASAAEPQVDSSATVSTPFGWDMREELASYRAGTLGVDVVQNDLRRIRNFRAAQRGRRVAQASVDASAAEPQVDSSATVSTPFGWDMQEELASYRAGTLGVDVVQNDLRRIRSFRATQHSGASAAQPAPAGFDTNAGEGRN